MLNLVISSMDLNCYKININFATPGQAQIKIEQKIGIQ